MPFFDFDTIKAEHVTPKHSRAVGPLVSGQQIEVGGLRFEAGEGSQQHAHPQEQIVVILRGRARVSLDGTTQELTPGQGFLVPVNVPHQMTLWKPPRY